MTVGVLFVMTFSISFYAVIMCVHEAAVIMCMHVAGMGAVVVGQVSCCKGCYEKCKTDKHA